jgi:hypothetical protein
MSWVRLLGETWRATDDTAELHVHLWPEDAGYPRQSWSLSLRHNNTSDELDPLRRYLQIEVFPLHFHEPEWRRLSGLEIRADARWHEANEFTQEHGRLDISTAEVRYGQVIAPPGKPSPPGGHDAWVAHDFILRLGTRDGLSFPCELDAWLIPAEEYYRAEPESVAETARFGEGPPNLRVLAQAVFNRGTIVMPRCGDDPLPLARRYLREAIGCEEMRNAKVEWALRAAHDKPDESVRMPGWSSTVQFSTGG